MIRSNPVGRWSAFFGALIAYASSVQATNIGGTIATTLTITENSQLVDDVTCTVTGAPCIVFGASHLTLGLNGFTMTGQADTRTACSGGPSAFPPEHGIDVSGRADVAILGPGLVQQFRGPGIFIRRGSNNATVKGVTVSTNCASGILIGGGTGHDIAENVAIRNGHKAFECGGI